jgi:hypothetical protein
MVGAPKPAVAAAPPPEAKPKAEPAAPEAEGVPADAGAIAKKKRAVMIVAGVAAVIVLSAAGFFAYRSFLAPTPPPPPPKAKAPAAPAKAPVAKTPTAPAPTAAPAKPATPSETLNKLAQVPGKAVTKAKEAIAAREASGQGKVQPVLDGQDLANKPAAGTPVEAAPAPAAPKPATAKTSVGRGMQATTQLEMAALDASAEFRSFVANAKVSGVFQGTPARAMINGRLVRAGELVDAGLGIRFEGVDPEKRHLIFKDKAGALVARKY